MNPMGSVISRIGSDFFALMVPGAYVLLCVAALILSGVPHWDPFSVIAAFNAKLMTQWPTTVSILVLAYLVGQVIHAFPVNYADELCGSVFGRFAKHTWHKLLYEDYFPYAPALRKTLSQVKGTHPLAGDAALPEDGSSLHTTFNYWKMSICDASPNLFVFAQAREARVRLYAGMFWSGLAGCGSGVLSLTVAYLFGRSGTWLALILAQILISVIVLSMFGYHLRRVRAQEVDTVFLGYLWLSEKRTLEIDNKE